MDFIDFCIKIRWWFLIIGILTLSIGIGIFFLFLSVIGFVKNSSLRKRKTNITKKANSLRSPENKSKKKVGLVVLTFVVIAIIIIIIFGDSWDEVAEKQRILTEQAMKEDTLKNTPISVSIDELYSTFSDYSELSEIQKGELYKNKYNGRIIKTSIRADKINEASLSSQYVVLQMSGLASCTAKAFFSSSEKNKLLNANLGDTIIFTGKLINYDFGFASCIEFGDSKVIEIKRDQP